MAAGGDSGMDLSCWSFCGGGPTGWKNKQAPSPEIMRLFELEARSCFYAPRNCDVTMRNVQRAELFDHEEPQDDDRAAGIQEVLPPLPQAHSALRSEIKQGPGVRGQGPDFLLATEP